MHYLVSVNREEYLTKTFPLEDGTTYIQNLDNTMCEYSGLPNVQSYEPKGAGVGGESLKENFIDSASLSEDRSADFMYNWIRKHSKK